MSERYGNFLVWDGLDKATQDDYRVRAGRLLTVLSEEIDKSLLTDEEMRQVVLDNIKLFDNVDKAPTLLFVVAQAQLDKVLALFKEKGDE